jgi:hypothetical protein
MKKNGFPRGELCFKKIKNKRKKVHMGIILMGSPLFFFSSLFSSFWAGSGCLEINP